MFLVGIFQWWYGSGWLRHLRRSYIGILRTADFFSIGLLLRTLFNPFKQISANSGAQNTLPLQLSAFFDRLFSRLVGATIRSMTIIIGLVVISLRCLWVVASVFGWTLLPLTPVIGLVLWLSGVTL